MSAGVTVFVEHYLNADGKAFFPGWFRGVLDVISTQPGFDSLTYENDTVDPEKVKLILKFDSEKELEDWIAAPEHGDVVDQLDLFRTKAWKAARVVGEVTVSYSLLSWMDITPATGPAAVPQ